MPAPDLKEGIRNIGESIMRGKGNFALSRAPASEGPRNEFVLSAGSHQAVQVKNGFMVSIGLDREKVARLRDWCDDLLSQG
jgi:hypothetical protein